MSRLRPSLALWLGLALFLLAFALLQRASSSVGIPRDEAIYFEASRRQGAFWSEVARDPRRIADRELRDRHFAFNREHPVVMKSLAGVSGRLFARAPVVPKSKKPDPWSPNAGLLPWMSERAAMRLPAQLLAAFGIALLGVFAFGAARRRGAPLAVAAGASLIAGLGFASLPRVAFHASLHAFDMPIAVMSLVVVLAYLRGLASLRWSVAAGVLLGLAIGVKHNALFLGPLLAIHYYASLAWRRQRTGEFRSAELLPPVLLAMALLAPLIAWASWPWMWSDTAARLQEYVEFHARHSYYNMEFMGVNYNRPPMPWAYPFVMLAATVPATWLMLALVGVGVRDEAPAPASPKSKSHHGPSWLRAGLWPSDRPQRQGWLFGGLALAFISLIALPAIPIFGGTKHWLTAYPFLALLAARAWTRAWMAFGARAKLALPAAFLALGPGLWATVHGHPHNLSQYAPLVGGARGAADLGLNRGFWGYAVTPLLGADVEPKSGPVYLHDLHPLAKKQYERDGDWPGWRSGAPGNARAGLIFHEAHMVADEVQLVNGLESAAPSAQVRLDDVPLTSLYQRP